MRYTTLTDVIHHEILPALGEHRNDYDVEAIAREAFAYRVDTDERGRELLNTAGFEQVVTADEFWAIVEKHARHMIPVTDLRPGDRINLEPLVRRYAPDDESALIAAENELALCDDIAENLDDDEA